MSRITPFVLALTLAGLGLPTTMAQDAITIDPFAAVNRTSRQGQLLTGLYATQATLEICDIAVTEPAASAMTAHRRQLQGEFRMDDATGDTAYQAVKAEVETAGVDCAPDSPDRVQAEKAVALYSGS